MFEKILKFKYTLTDNAMLPSHKKTFMVCVYKTYFYLAVAKEYKKLKSTAT